MAVIEAWSIGPFQKPLPWMQTNSPPERLTPSSRTVAPLGVTSRLPDTLSAGAAPVCGGGLVGGVVGGVVAGVVGGVVGGLVVPPVHVMPLTVKVAGTGLVPDQAPVKPSETDAPEPSEPFQDMLAAVTCAPDWVQVAFQPWVILCAPVGKSKPSVQDDSGSPRLVIAAD
jgi:hypothetical protein